MKYLATLTLFGLWVVNAASQTTVNSTDTGDDGTDGDTDALHGWCQCVTISGAVIEGSTTQRACQVIATESGSTSAKYDTSNQRCFTQGSHIPGNEFQRLCRSLSSNKDNSRCS